MFEARLLQGALLKKIIDAIKDLVTDANFDCTASEFSLQAMDSSHVSLVALRLDKDGFDHFRCDKPISMGMVLVFLEKGCVEAGYVAIHAPALIIFLVQASISIACSRSSSALVQMISSPFRPRMTLIALHSCLRAQVRPSPSVTDPSLHADQAIIGTPDAL
jgi:hypothetical protein